MSWLLSLVCFTIICTTLDSAPSVHYRGAYGNIYTVPRHVHISFGDSPLTLVVTYSTINLINQSMVVYGIAKPGKLDQFAKGSCKLFVDGGNLKASQYIHRVTITDLEPYQEYIYRVGDGPSLSAEFTFHTFTDDPLAPVRFAIYGDMGVQNAQSLPRLLNDVLVHKLYDVILHVGDFAYDMAFNNSKVGDAFMEMIEPLASRIPYMTTVGNHEFHYNFSNYKNRFTMPSGDRENMFYSYNLGRTHIISMSTEFYFYVNFGIEQIFRQYEWLENDLKVANLPKNRAKHPWIIFLGHRPIYCSNNESDCGIGAEWIRNGIPIIRKFGLDKLMYKYGVDIGIWAHEHSYERLWPVYDSKVMNGTTHTNQPYTNPRATVHFITGSAGCRERHDHFRRMVRPYSAFHSLDYGYSRLTVYNATHAYWDQVSDDKKGKIIDFIWIIKDGHGPFHSSSSNQFKFHRSF